MFDLTNLRNKLLELTELVKAKAASRTVPFADDVDTVGGLTATQVRTGTTKAHVGLANLRNLPVATNAQMLDPNDNGCLVTPQLYHYFMSQYLPLAPAGQVYMGVGNKQVPYPPLTRMAIVQDGKEFLDAQSTEESFADVFNSWYRFSHRSGYDQPAIPDELEAWSYDEVTDTIVSTLNTVSRIGFISPNGYDNYTFEVVVSSNNNDDDSIGVVIGFAVVDGVEYSLIAERVLNGTGSTFRVYYNLTSDNSVLLGGNMLGEATNPQRNADGGTGWTGNTARIRVVRTGDTIVVSSTGLNETNYRTGYDITVDLTSLPELAKFRGPSPIGYTCQSQLWATWKTIQRPGSRLPIIDATTYTVTEWDGNAWVERDSTAYQNHLKPNLFYFNDVSGKLYYYRGDKNLVLFGQRGS